MDPASPELWGKVIAASVVPVVMITACGHLCNAFYNRLTAITSRLRALSLEALKDQEAQLGKARTDTQRIPRDRARVRVEARQRQADELLGRARLLRSAVACDLVAIGLMLLCSLTVGVGVFAPAALYVAAALFIAGIACVIAAVGFAIGELRHALGPIEMEHDLVVKLGKDIPADSPPAPGHD